MNKCRIEATNFIEVRNKIERSWERETSYKPDEWTKDNPAWGQCAVTTKLLYELMGGFCMAALFKYTDGIRWHYWNVIRDVDIDFTWRQMPAGTELFSLQQFPI